MLFCGRKKQILNHIEDTKTEDFSIFRQIEILGVEKEQIKVNVETSLQGIMDFLNSLKRVVLKMLP